MNVIVLDDDPMLLQYYRTTLKMLKRFTNVTEAVNGYQFRQGMYLRKQHVILCDVMLGKENGPDVMRANKALIGNTPIFLLSCSDVIEDIKKSLISDGLNVVKCIEKPVMPEMLKEVFKDD